MPHSNIAGAEPSTVTFRLGTFAHDRGSTTEHQEIVVLGGQESSLALGAILNTTPASTAWGLAVREVQPTTSVRVHQSSAADLNVTVAGYSTVVSVSTGSVRVHQSTAADLNVTVAGYVAPSTIVTVSTGSVRVHQSTAADLLATVTPSAGSTWAVRPLQSSAADLQVTATPAAGSTWAVRPLQSSQADLRITAYQSTAADFQATVTPVAGSTWAVRPLQSSQADLRITAYQSTAADLNAQVRLQDGSGNAVGSGIAALSSGTRGLAVREVIDAVTTFASTTVGQSSATTIISSQAASRGYVYAYSITSTLTTPVRGAFYDGANLLWPIYLGSGSSGVSGANLAVSPPGYLFRNSTGAALTFNFASSNRGVTIGLSYWVST